MDPKVFSVEEANRHIPRLQKILRQLRHLKTDIESKKVEMDLLEIVGSARQGVSVDTGVSKEMGFLNNLAIQFNQHLEQLEDMECQLKDLDQGLIDFFSVREGRLIYLCWKEGEKSVQYWHAPDGGFQGRKPI